MTAPEMRVGGAYRTRSGTVRRIERIDRGELSYVIVDSAGARSLRAGMRRSSSIMSFASASIAPHVA